MKKRSRNIRKRIRNRRMIKFSVAMCLVFALAFSFGGIFSYAGSNQGQAEQTHKYYTSIQIEHGDTLSTIAERFITTEYTDTESYIYEVAQMNHIDSEKPIHAGQYLIVPYFSAEIK